MIAIGPLYKRSHTPTMTKKFLRGQVPPRISGGDLGEKCPRKLFRGGRCADSRGNRIKIIAQVIVQRAGCAFISSSNYGHVGQLFCS